MRGTQTAATGLAAARAARRSAGEEKAGSTDGGGLNLSIFETRTGHSQYSREMDAPCLLYAFDRSKMVILLV